MSLSKKFSQFFQGPSGEKSSKRLIGIIGGFALIYLSVRGGEHFLRIENSEAISIFSIIAIWLLNKGSEINENKNIITQQKIEVKKKDDIIKVKKFQQKIIRKDPVDDTSDNRRKLLQFIFEERENPDK